MGRIRFSIMLIAGVSLIVYFAVNAMAGGKVVILEYALNPVASIDSGRLIKTEWTAKVQNRAPEQVRFKITIFFVDGNNEVVSQTESQFELTAKETKTFSDTVTLEANIANKIASTRVSIDETP